MESTFNLTPKELATRLKLTRTSLECPECGGPLGDISGRTEIECPYCNVAYDVAAVGADSKDDLSYVKLKALADLHLSTVIMSSRMDIQYDPGRYVERPEANDAFQRFLEERSPKQKLFLLLGEAGFGKTWLAAKWALWLREQGYIDGTCAINKMAQISEGDRQATIQIMESMGVDFERIKSAVKPVAKPAAKPVVKLAPKPATRSASAPAAKPAVRPAAKPAAKPRDAEAQLKQQLREELRQEFSGQLKEDIKKDIMESMKGKQNEAWIKNDQPDPEAAIEAQQEFNASKYFEFDFADRHLLTKLRQIIENANQLYEAKNFAEGIKILEMVETIELKEDEPDRSKMRVTVIKYLSEILPANPEAVAEQVPDVLEMIKKISSRYLQEKGYTLLASACKQSEQGYPYFDQIMDVLFGMLLKYQTTELYAIISLLESLINLVRGTTSPFVQKLVEYIKEKFDQIDDNDYKVRFIKELTFLEAYTDAKELGKTFKATTADESGERRAVLDALKENRDAYKAYLEKHPELAEAAEAEDADDYLEELNAKKAKLPAVKPAPKPAAKPAPRPAAKPRLIIPRAKDRPMQATMQTNRGTININLFDEVAPLACASFAFLANKGFYNGLTFHRVLKDFMIQGGDPQGTGMGGPTAKGVKSFPFQGEQVPYPFDDEFSPVLQFDRPGLLAMANAGPKTNGSQFFITHKATPHLNGKHTIFGEVKGPQDQKVVNAIKQGDKITKLVVS